MNPPINPVLSFVVKHRKLLLSYRFLPVFISFLLCAAYFLSVFYFQLAEFNPLLGCGCISIFFLLVYWSLCLPLLSVNKIKAIEKHISNLKFCEAAKLFKTVPNWLFWFPAAKYRLQLLQVKLLTKENHQLEAYELLQELRKQPLLPREKFNAEILLINILIDSANLKAASDQIALLKQEKHSDTEQQLLSMVEMYLLMESNHIAEAKALANQQLINPELKPHYKQQFLGNVGACEAREGNFAEALSLYRQALDLIVEQNASFYHLEIAVDNLIQTYAKQGELSFLEELIKKLEAKLDENSADQKLALSNIHLHYARQLNDRNLLVANYQKAKIEIEPLLTAKQRFHYHINQLRMHWNDNIEPQQALAVAMNCLLFRPELSLYEYLTSIKEVQGVLEQMLKKYGAHPVPMAYYGWLLLEWERMIPEVDNYLDRLPTALPAMRAAMLGFKIQTIKNKIAIGRVDDLTFKQLFELLNQQVKSWQHSGNEYAYLNALNIVVDEYVAYRKGIDDPKFQQDFELAALQTLEKITEILNTQKHQLVYKDFYVSAAYYYSFFELDKQQAKRWLSLVDEAKTSANHNAKWHREQLAVAKAWVEGNRYK